MEGDVVDDTAQPYAHRAKQYSEQIILPLRDIGAQSVVVQRCHGQTLYKDHQSEFCHEPPIFYLHISEDRVPETVVLVEQVFNDL